MVSHQMLIGGQLVVGDHLLDVIDPATGRAFTTVGRASLTQASQAVHAAKSAFTSWTATSLEERRRCVVALADAIMVDREDFARALVSEQGKPLNEALDEVDWTVLFIRHYATMDLPIEVIQEDDDFRMETHHKPLGVVVGIAPWNFPLFLLTLKLAAAVLTGNTFVGKPAPTTPVTSLMVGERAHKIFPSGVVNMVTDENDLGELLTQHADVAKISFTGSTATGRKVAASALSSFKRLSLELGGNDASIVLDDVDVETVAKKIFDAAFLNAGQVCIAIKRVYVHTDIYDRFTAALAALANAAHVGDGLQQGTRIGPIQNRMQFEKAKRFLEIAHRDGKVIVGGNVPGGNGYFIQPTIVRDIEDTSPLVHDEQFAPILPIVRFDDIDVALTNANATRFGLGGSVWSGDAARAYELAKKMDTGTVWVNHHLHLHPAVPLGGAKESGVGVDYGVDGLKEYTQTTVIRIAK
ncbi:aldehyde dehydrogenase family protein [Rhizobium leguminosarum]|uniref:aldehyde dehydrogenase family protein n=1 Tax=Rhizobium leguminosarum TaxID=384 RepID=UPI003F9E1FC6